MYKFIAILFIFGTFSGCGLSDAVEDAANQLNAAAIVELTDEEQAGLEDSFGAAFLELNGLILDPVFDALDGDGSGGNSPGFSTLDGSEPIQLSSDITGVTITGTATQVSTATGFEITVDADVVWTDLVPEDDDSDEGDSDDVVSSSGSMSVDITLTASDDDEGFALQGAYKGSISIDDITVLFEVTGSLSGETMTVSGTINGESFSASYDIGGPEKDDSGDKDGGPGDGPGDGQDDSISTGACPATPAENVICIDHNGAAVTAIATDNPTVFGKLSINFRDPSNGVTGWAQLTFPPDVAAGRRTLVDDGVTVVCFEGICGANRTPAAVFKDDVQVEFTEVGSGSGDSVVGTFSVSGAVAADTYEYRGSFNVVLQ